MKYMPEFLFGLVNLQTKKIKDKININLHMYEFKLVSDF